MIWSKSCGTSCPPKSKPMAISSPPFRIAIDDDNEPRILPMKNWPLSSRDQNVRESDKVELMQRAFNGELTAPEHKAA